MQSELPGRSDTLPGGGALNNSMNGSMINMS